MTLLGSGVFHHSIYIFIYSLWQSWHLWDPQFYIKLFFFSQMESYLNHTLQIKDKESTREKMSWAPHFWRQHKGLEIHGWREFFSCLPSFLLQPSNLHSPAWVGPGNPGGGCHSAAEDSRANDPLHFAFFRQMFCPARHLGRQKSTLHTLELLKAIYCC